MPPNLGIFFFAFHFESASFLRGLDDCLGTMCFQELSRVVMDVDFVDSHGVMLLFCASEHTAHPNGRL